MTKRISHLFGGSKGSKKSSPASTVAATSKASDTTLNSEDQSHLITPNMSRASIATISDTGKHGLQPSSGALHQRSWSSPDARKISSSTNSSSDALNMSGSASPARSSIILETRDRKTRDSGFEDVNRQGHRRYSSMTPGAGVNHPPLLQFNQTPRSPSSLAGGDTLYIDQQQYQNQQPKQSQTQFTQLRASISPSQFQSGNAGRATPQPLTPMDEQLRSRRSTLADPSMYELPSHVTNTASRRSSAPVMTETLVSRIDREKSTVCFQSPSKQDSRDSYSREANLDPALSSLVQQHRRDYQINTRLGGGTTPRRDFNSSQVGNSPHHHSVNTGLPSPATPGMHPLEPSSKRASGYYNQPPLVHSAGQRVSYSGSNGALLNAAANFSARQQQEQQEQQLSTQIAPQSSSHGGHGKPQPKRQSSAGYFNIPQQHQQQQVFMQTATSHTPSPSHVPGATASNFEYGHELSIAMQYQQHQQQQVQLQIQQYQLQQLQQQQQQFYQAISPLTLLQHPDAQQLQLQQQIAQHQQSQQQLEQLQQIRIQQQQLIMQQQQQLQQQLEQARAVVAASSTLPTPTETDPTVTAIVKSSPQQQQQQSVMGNLPAHFALPAAPVLTTAMGIGMGMGVNPSSMNMNLMSMGINSYGQPTSPMMAQVMSSQMTPQLTSQFMGYSTTPLYPYQQQQQLAGGIGGVVSAVPAAGGSASA
ncbi:hypothetical protein BGX27_007102 [Mortierella sp. AM989]|nr:hypothetical protein BGX27_007102 [Mortierella sp. AM989]